MFPYLRGLMGGAKYGNKAKFSKFFFATHTHVKKKLIV